MYPRILGIPHESRQSFFLFGPRGTGKTTWLKQRFPDAVYLDLLDHALYLELLAQPQRLRNLIPPGHDGWVVLDEVQRAGHRRRPPTTRCRRALDFLLPPYSVAESGRRGTRSLVHSGPCG